MCLPLIAGKRRHDFVMVHACPHSTTTAECATIKLANRAERIIISDYARRDGDRCNIKGPHDRALLHREEPDFGLAVSWKSGAHHD